MLTLFRLAKWLRNHDRTSYYGLRTLHKMQGAKLFPVAREVLRFVNQHYHGDPLADYTRRLEDLRRLQQEFEKTGTYPAKSYAEVISVDDEVYKLALLLSIVCTNHRFEIMQELRRFLESPCDAPRALLSIGYGTGFELKLARDALPGWDIEAFDNSESSFAYAQDLLQFFDSAPVTLRQESFPFENAAGIESLHRRFGKIVVCELLEHLENPLAALISLREVLADGGRMFLTMAVNIAQEDHLFLYKSAEEARFQVSQGGYRIVRETLAPAVVLPFAETWREKIFRKGNYICTVERSDGP